MLEEKISKHLGVPFVVVQHEGEKKYLCCNGVLFNDNEYEGYPDLQLEYKRREREDKLYDYNYAKSTGLLRKKRGQFQSLKPIHDNPELSASEEVNIKETESLQKGSEEDLQGEWIQLDKKEKQGFSVLFIVALLTFTSLISGYISTLHTATYLFDYVDVVSAWLMSASVTVYNATAFEVAVIFKTSKRYSLALLFITLWGMVTLFSMATTVSVFYDMFNFSETQIAEENKTIDSGKLSLNLLLTKEKDLREAIAFKKQDIEYRQDRDYATTAVRLELEALQKELQENLSEQQKILSETPEVTQEVTKRKESLFSFLGRLLHIEGGVFEFTMSTLSAIFVNLICPFSLIAVAELKKKKEE